MLTKRTLREFLLTSLMCLGVASQTLFAQINHEGMPLNWEENIPVLIDWQTFDAPDLTALQEEDKATAKFKDAPWRFGIEHDVLWNSLEEGIWTQEQGFDVWRLGVRADLTKSWSFHLSQFDIPKGGVLFVWNEDRSAFLGSFNHENMKKWDGFAIGVIEGEGAVLEYHQPQTLDTKPTIEIGQVVQGYRSLLIRQNELLLVKSSQGPFGNSGACNINVNCPEGADWQTEKKAVALIVNGGFAACTGSLVNNTANDGTPYFLTANHCLGNPNTWTYYFNHESSTCSGSTGPTDNSISGGSLLVSDGGSDVALIQLSEAPPASWNIEYAGWDASGATPENATGIHHPSGDVKKICFEENSPYESSTGGAQVWWIDAWEAGVTEPGSSGSPLFDQNHRIIGQLYGGAAACSGSVNNGAYDFYGRFNISWNLGLSEYLDPQNSGVLVLDGFPTGFNTDYGCTSADACNYSPLAIFDDGSCAVDDECGICGGDNSSCGGCTDPSACNYEASAIVDDGSCVLDGVTISFSLLTDNYPAETTWNISDSDGDIVLEGGPYSQTQTTFETSTCIPSGCYTLTVNDSYGDGLQYSGTVGNYILTDSEENVLAEMIEGGNFGYQANHDFCVESGSPDIPGCTELSSCNFDPEATVDDGSCVDPIELVFEDVDGDGIGGTVGIADVCAPLGPNLSLETGDCDDDDATIYPGAPGTGEGVDNNCNGVIDAEEAADGCLGDLNQDGAVTVADILAMLAAFGCLTDCMGDVDGDGSVTVQDLLVLLGEFGSTC